MLPYIQSRNIFVPDKASSIFFSATIIPLPRWIPAGIYLRYPQHVIPMQPVQEGKQGHR